MWLLIYEKEIFYKDLALSSNERLYFKGRSMFFSKKLINLKPNHFKIYTFHAGFKNKMMIFL